MFYTYIIYSPAANKFYIGSTANLDKRIQEHNNGLSRYTKQAQDWEIGFSKSFLTRGEAIRFEKYIKSWKDRRLLEKLFSQGL